MNTMLIGFIVVLAVGIIALGSMWLIGPWRPRSRHSGPSQSSPVVLRNGMTAWGSGTRRDRH